ncbi:MAG: DnaJ domain-containing protein [bacterium]|nr:DnaJ domain-containing protein [bacterium]
MTTKYKDYYDILGVSRDASKEDVQKAYRKLARQYHPDVNKDAGAENRFKEINEAYEVLKDPDKRQRYDSLGANWSAGQDFQAPPGWDNARYEFHTGPGGFDGFESMGDFSDFFREIFGAGFGSAFSGADPRARGARGFQRPSRGRDIEAEMEVTLEDVYRGATKQFHLQTGDPHDLNGSSARRYEVKIPKGARDGTRIRLSGGGGDGRGGPSGDLLVRLRIAPHARYRVNGYDLEADLPVAAWEAALGADVKAETLDGPVTVHVPAGIGSGKKLRLQGKGLPGKTGSRGDLFLRIRIAVPRSLSSDERRLFEELSRVSRFNPRNE